MPSDFRSLASVSPSKYVTAAFTGSAYEITENQVILTIRKVWKLK